MRCLRPNPPRAFLDGNPEIVRIVKDFGSAERAYHKKTGFFPIMHLIAVRKSLVDENPDLPVALLTAFTEARNIAMQGLREVWLGSANRLSLPWLNEAMEKTMSSMGLDYWPYGYAQNQKELETACRYSIEQYLAGTSCCARRIVSTLCDRRSLTTHAVVLLLHNTGSLPTYRHKQSKYHGVTKVQGTTVASSATASYPRTNCRVLSKSCPRNKII